MALGVLNNLSAIYAENNLNNTNNSLQTVLQQLSSGSKINSGADDAAGLSLVNGLEANQAALTQSKTNATEGVGLLQVADGALSQVTSLLDRAITLATEASNGTLNTTQESAANQEYQSILSEVNNIGQTTTYNQEQVFNGQEVAIYTGDSSASGSSLDDLNIRSLSESSVGDTGGQMAYSSGSNSVFINLSTATANAKTTDTLNPNGQTTIDINYLIKGADGTASTAKTTITVGSGTSYANTSSGLISAINDSGLGLTASFATQAQAGLVGGGTQTGIEITGGLVSAGIDPSTVSTSGDLDASGIPASELLTQGQTVSISVGGSLVGTVKISSSVNTLTELAKAIGNIAGAPVTASVINNGDGTQSLALADAASGQGTLSVTIGTGGGTLAPVFNTPTNANNAVAVDNDSSNVTGIASQAAVDGALTVGVGSVSADSTLSGTFVVTNTPSGGGAAVTESFVMGGAGSYANHTYSVNGSTLAALTAAITSQKNAGGDLGVTVGAGTATTAFTLTGAAGSTITTSVSNLTYTNTLDGATPLVSTSTDATTGIATVAVAQTNALSDALTGSIVLQNGTGTSTTFVMGAGVNNTTNAAVGGVPANTYFTGNATLVGADAAGTLGALKDAVNQYLGASVTATVNGQGLTVISKAPGTTVSDAGGNTLTNTNLALGLYTPTLATFGDFDTAQLGLTNKAGTEITGTIGGGDNLTGSIVLTNGGVSDTFVMGTNSHGTNATGIDSTVNGGVASATGSNEYWVGNGGAAALTTAINALAAAEVAQGNATSGIKLNAQPAPSGGVYLQSTIVDDGVTYDGITMTASTLAVAQAASATSSVTGETFSAGTDSTATVAPASGSDNTTDIISGNIVLTDTPTAGSPVMETFSMGSAANDGKGTGSLSGSVYTVDGDTLADLQNAINSQTTLGAGSLGLGLNALASTNGLTLNTPTNNGASITVGTGASNTLSDTSQGTSSSVTLGSFANENDSVTGSISFDVNGTPESYTITSGSTVSTMIDKINLASLGVTAKWVAGSNGYGSVQLTATAEGSAGQISNPITTVADTTNTAALSYIVSGNYSTGISNSPSTASLYDSTTGQSAASFVDNTSGTSGIATISYSDGAGESLTSTDLTSQTDAENALNILNIAIIDVAAQDGYIGAQINTLNSISQVMSTQQENVASAQNAIQATDYASATSNMSKYEILSQTGIAALAQANSVQQEVTKLLQ